MSEDQSESRVNGHVLVGLYGMTSGGPYSGHPLSTEKEGSVFLVTFGVEVLVSGNEEGTRRREDPEVGSVKRGSMKRERRRPDDPKDLA